MNTAHDHGYTYITEVSGHFIGTVRLRGESGNAHQVRPRHGRIVRQAEILVYYRDFPRRWCQARQNHKTEWFPHTVTIPTAFLDFDDAHKRI
ncbi:MAG: hypothetical protein WAV28_02365 [Sedimentisphaerales bacterium]